MREGIETTTKTSITTTTKTITNMTANSEYNKEQTISWGFVGCGAVTEVKSGPAFQKIEGSRVAAVMRRNADKARDYARRHGVPKWYDDADELIADPGVNAVYVATPPGSHAEYAIRAAKADKPVYLEKPMGLNHAECLEIIEAFEKAGVPLFVAYYRRALPAFLKIRDLLRSGAVGEPRLVTAELHVAPRPRDLETDNLPWHVLPEISGGGYFIDQASHQLDLLDFFFGPVAEVRGIARNQARLYPAEDAVAATFAFESGVIGTGLWCHTVHPRNQLDRTEIVGSRGKIVYSTFGPNPVRLETASGVEEFSFEPPEHIQQPLIQIVIDALQGRAQCPSIGSSAARTTWVMDEILRERRAKSI